MDLDSIDIANLIDAWHPDIREIVSSLDEECLVEFIKGVKVTDFPISRYKEVLNFTNTQECKQILYRILREKDHSNFISILKERDSLHPRLIERGITIEDISESVKSGEYHPICFLQLNERIYIIDGRTRFYCCIFHNTPAKVRILQEYDILNKCNISKKS